MPVRLRRMLAAVALLVVLAFNFADRIYTKIELLLAIARGEQAPVSWATEFDSWLLSWGIEPIFAAMFVAIVISGYLIPDGWPFLREHFFRRSAAAFGEAFNELDSADPRKDFRLSMERAYTSYCQKKGVLRQHKSLSDLVDAIHFPTDFPPSQKPISGYLASADWAGAKPLIDFLRELYSAVPNRLLKNSATRSF